MTTASERFARRARMLMVSTVCVICAWPSTTRAQEPTAQDIVNGWAALSGGLSAKLVYWDETIRVMDLTTGAVTSVNDYPCTERHGLFDDDYVPHTKWSPNGARIIWQHDVDETGVSTLMVMNADGSNCRAVAGTLSVWNRWDPYASGWWDDDWVVYSTAPDGQSIARTRLDAVNNPVETVVVRATPPAGSYYDAVDMCGDYLSYMDTEANQATGGLHRSVVYNTVTGVSHEVVPRDGDACHIRLCPDGSGTSWYYPATHTVGNIEAVDGTILKQLPAVDGSINWLRWSNHADYVAHNKTNSPIKDDQKAWIRKLSAPSEYVYLGAGVWTPDLWIGAAQTLSVTITQPSSSDAFSAPATVTIQAGASADVTRVEFYNGATLLGEDTSSPYEHVWSGVGEGTYTLTATAYGSGSASVTSDPLTITVAAGAGSTPPVAGDDVATVYPQTPVAIDVLANDTDANGDALTIDSFTQPSNGTVVESAGGLAYTSDVGFTGADSFTYVVSDGAGGTDSATVTVSVVVEPAITISSPVAGDTLYVGTTRQVCWSVERVDDVQAYLSTDGGASWELTFRVRSDQVGWCEYAWTVPDRPSATCVLTVQEYFMSASDQTGTFTISSVTDNDGDGMDDGWEVQQFGDLTHDATTDADGDGRTDADEFQLGSDPTVADASTGGDAAIFSCAAGAGGAFAAFPSLVGLIVLVCVAARRQHVVSPSVGRRPEAT